MAYNDFIQSLAESRGGNFSRGTLVDLAGALYNESPDFNVYTKKGDTYVATTINPGKALRANMVAPILKSFGVDKAELPKLDEVKISKAGAEALADYSLMLVKEYISDKGLGRRLTLPMTDPNETIMSLQYREVPAETKATTMIVKGDDGVYTTKPTGKTVTTAAYQKLLVRNRVPSWLKTTKTA